MAVEFKSVGRPYRHGNLDRLWAYTSIVCASDVTLLDARGDLSAVLVVPRRTPSLENDVARMGLEWESAGSGYWTVTGGLFTLHVVEIDLVAEQEEDDVLRLFGHGTEHTLAARQFWAEQVGSKEAKMSLEELEGYDEVMRRFIDQIPPRLRLEGLSPEERLEGLPLEQRLAGLAPEQRLAGLAPEQRLAGLAPEQRLAGLPPEQRVAGLAPEQRVAGLTAEQVLLTLPDDTLRSLSDDYIATLSPETQAAIRARR